MMNKIFKVLLLTTAILVSDCSNSTVKLPEAKATAQKPQSQSQQQTQKVNTSSNQKITSIQGKVVRISDGDTVTVLMNNQQYKIRLNGIDAPEHSQPFGSKSREYLRDMINQKTVTVTVQGKDRYGRYLGVISTPEIKDVNAEMLKAGCAWHYKQYNKSPNYASYETSAKASKKGLWSEPNPTPPWVFRRQNKNNQQKKSGL